MKKFEDMIMEQYATILEQDEIPPTPAPPNSGSALPGVDSNVPMGGDMPMGGGNPMEGNPQQGQDVEEMDNEVKRDADPREYTRTLLALLTDTKEGVSPEMFDDFIDSVSFAITKVKDKPGLKRFYSEFYQKLTSVLELREELKSMFKQLSGTMKDLVGAQDEPNDAGGGVGMGGPSGPGVN
jgi:hypothetical protein